MKLTNQSLEYLLMLCLDEHQQAQLEIYNRYYKAMYNTALRIVRDRFEAEDVMQESFLTAFAKLKTLKDPATFGSWLKRIVINKSIYHYNSTKAKMEDQIDKKLYKMAVVTEEKADDSNISEKAKMVTEAINRLKDNYKMGLTLHLIEGYDYEEISEIMKISYANCRTMISRAKESLRNSLQPLTQNLYE